MNVPECLNALREINHDPNVWNSIWDVPPDTFKKWWLGQEDMPLHYRLLYTTTLSIRLDSMEKESHGKSRGIFSSCYQHLKLAKQESDNYPEEVKEKAKQIATAG